MLFIIYLIFATMKKMSVFHFAVQLMIALGLFGMGLPLSGQDTLNVSPSLPENINQIITRSCMPCHSNDGGLMSRTKLNFSEWTSYSSDKQAEKANKIYSELSENKMPPKKARESKPELIPTSDQVDMIKKWSESFAVPEK
jgi:hypothetical protein